MSLINNIESVQWFSVLISLTRFFYWLPGEEEVSENSIPQSSATDEVSPSEAVASEIVEKKEEVVAETVPDEVSSSEDVASEDAEKKEEVVAEVPVAEAETPAPVVTEASSEENGGIKGIYFAHF